MYEDLKGKAAIVTGAGRGIGEAIARSLASNGAKVLVADVSGDEKAVAESIGGDARAHSVDISSPESVEAMVAAAVEHYGTVDILVNNAGIDGGYAAAADCSIENFDKTVAINLRGTFLGLHYTLPVMLKKGSGAVVNVSSLAGVMPFPGMMAYSTTKSGILGMTRCAAADHSRQGVRVNAVLPGVIETPMYTNLQEALPDVHAALAFQATLTPLGRSGTGEEVANVVTFLASDASSYLTGQSVKIDGGISG
ncbi:SDR family NAD(P)-dependent oxidoreductase [Amycolatopsis silviterrae]|uniref:SDR family NAD(P)-dependent oxidoreductase n=1 Tax=Amycolatopsis silviterrae TaxID=1656914 RepID=A0ABW5HJT6_9PSEU